MSDKQNLVYKNLENISNNTETSKNEKISQSIQKLKNAGVNTDNYSIQGCSKAIGNGSISDYFKERYNEHIRAQKQSETVNAAKNAFTFDTIAAKVKDKVRKTSPHDDSQLSSKVLTKKETGFFAEEKHKQAQNKIRGLTLEAFADQIHVKEDEDDEIDTPDDSNDDWLK